MLLFYEQNTSAEILRVTNHERLEMSNAEHSELLLSVGANAARIAGMLDMAMSMLGQE